MKFNPFNLIGGENYDMKDSEPRLALKLAPDRNQELRAQFSAVRQKYMC